MPKKSHEPTVNINLSLLQVKNHSNVNTKDVIGGLQIHQIERNTHMCIHQINLTIVALPDVINLILIHHHCGNT